MTLGQQMKSARRARGMTQRELAGGTLSESFVSMIEHDKVRPSLETLEVLARRLNVPLAALIGGIHPSRRSAELELRRCEALLRQHKFTDALEGLSRLLPILNRAGDPGAQVRAEIGLGQAFVAARQFDLAEGHLQAAHARARRLGDHGLLGAAANAWGFFCYRARRLAQAREILEQAAADLEGLLEHADLRGKILANLGRVYVDLGLPAQAMRLYADAQRLLGASADPAQRALLHFNMGVACEQQQSLDEAQAHFDQALELFRVQENLNLLSVVLRSIGMLRLQQGAVPEAMAALEQSLVLARQVGDDAGIAQALVELARTQLRAGRTALATERAAEAERVAARIGDPLEAARAAIVLAETDAVAGRLSDAQGRLRRAIAELERLEASADLARAHRVLGEVLLRAGKRSAAAPHLAQALTLADGSPMAPP